MTKPPIRHVHRSTCASVQFSSVLFVYMKELWVLSFIKSPVKTLIRLPMCRLVSVFNAGVRGGYCTGQTFFLPNIRPRETDKVYI